MTYWLTSGQLLGSTESGTVSVKTSPVSVSPPPDSLFHIAATESDAVNTELNALTGSTLAQDVLDQAFSKVTFTADPLPATLQASADHAVAVGQLDQSDVDQVGDFGGLYSLDLLNQALTAAGLKEVSSS